MFMPSLTHLSLFSGIGGIDLAAEWAGFETVGQCEFADYPRKVLEKHWPDVPRWKDVRDVTATSFLERTRLTAPTLISAGFPCQPHSLVGKRKASGDERDLWPELRRVLCEIRPQWGLLENVRGLLSSGHNRFFGGILRDLADLGYAVGWCLYGANRVGAIHQRERVFIVAYAPRGRWDGLEADFQDRCPELDPSPMEVWQNDARHVFHDLGRNVSNPSDGVLRNDDGLSERMDNLVALGNAVVPWQVYPILRMIAMIETEYAKQIKDGGN